MPEHQDALGPEQGTRAVVPAGPLHEVVLLGDGGELGAPDDTPLHQAEEQESPGVLVIQLDVRDAFA